MRVHSERKGWRSSSKKISRRYQIAMSARASTDWAMLVETPKAQGRRSPLRRPKAEGRRPRGHPKQYLLIAVLQPGHQTKQGSSIEKFDREERIAGYATSDNRVSLYMRRWPRRSLPQAAHSGLRLRRYQRTNRAPSTPGRRVHPQSASPIRRSVAVGSSTKPGVAATCPGGQSDFHSNRPHKRHRSAEAGARDRNRPRLTGRNSHGGGTRHSRCNRSESDRPRVYPL